jgi:hypothetical protein
MMKQRGTKGGREKTEEGSEDVYFCKEKEGYRR